LLFAPSASAQWSTNVWPSWQFPGKQRVDEVVAALNERSLACGSGPYTNAAWFAERYSLIQAKNKIIALQPTYLDMSLELGGTYDTWWRSNVLAAAFPKVFKLKSLIQAGAPTNYFEYTPWFDLCSHSNGWRYMTNLIDQLQYTHQGATWGNMVSNRALSDSGHFWATWAEATAVAEAGWPPAIGSEVPNVPSATYRGDYEMLYGWKYRARIEREKGYGIISGIWTNVAHQVDHYPVVNPPYLGTFSAEGDNVWTVRQFYATTDLGYYPACSNVYGDADITLMPDRCSEPSSYVNEGWWMSGVEGVIKWHFKYRN
jgi:hypothetical protein